MDATPILIEPRQAIEQQQKFSLSRRCKSSFRMIKQAALKAKPSAHGLSVEDWIGRLAVRHSRYDLAELIEKCDRQAQLSAEDRHWMGSSQVNTAAKSWAPTTCIQHFGKRRR